METDVFAGAVWQTVVFRDMMGEFSMANEVAPSRCGGEVDWLWEKVCL